MHRTGSHVWSTLGGLLPGPPLDFRCYPAQASDTEAPIQTETKSVNKPIDLQQAASNTNEFSSNLFLQFPSPSVSTPGISTRDPYDRWVAEHGP